MCSCPVYNFHFFNTYLDCTNYKQMKGQGCHVKLKAEQEKT